MAPRNLKGKLRNKIFLLIAAVGILPLLIAGALTVYVVTNSHRDDVAKLEAAVLREREGKIQEFVNGSILGQTRVLVPFAPGASVATSAQEFVLEQTLSALSFIRAESFLDLSGKETVRLDRTHLKGYGTGDLRDFGTDPGFMAAKGGNFYVGSVFYDGGKPIVTFASPVKSNTGDTLGVVRGEAELGEVQRIVADAKIGDTGYLYLVDQNGNLIGAGGDLANEPAGSARVAQEGIVSRVLAGDDLLTPATQMRYASASGKTVVAAAETLSEPGNVTWGLVAEWPTAEADAVINALLLRNILVLLGVLILVVLLSVFTALFLARPINTLEAGTERVAQGKFDEGVNIRTGDELEELGDAFNEMMIKLKELEQLKDEFVFIAAHELRTPVAAMKGYLQLILEGTTGAITDATRSFIEKVIASNQRLIQLVNDLLEVARSQAGRLTIKVTPVGLEMPIRGTLDELKSLADEKGTKLAYDPPAGLPNVLADSDRIKEVMVNLVGNAIKYMGGAGMVTIAHEKKDNELITKVADTGLGISKEAQEKLFTKFYRVQTDKTKDITGTGLGLFIVKEIIEKMNGRIWVDSEEGKGTTFSFSLPVAP